ncbi:hypothetical protein FSO04_24330 [Paraburkholderia madseniana]|uniref:Uncharacterized protein n=1 Tax=Paraburkholderia madseniana TaxID=2599607 RepID=A0A6N6WCW5_9BURK|nr:hypothetical protein [Paraburkholderia madseniana]KAE8757350.1 hypothetical protein FSO04_24330 [Paraburkholderia madseniana]
MSNIETGGRAFPWCGDLNDMPSINLGMTLRDYFASKAMAAMIGNYSGTGAELLAIQEGLSKAAYEYADAMLYARSQP